MIVAETFEMEIKEMPSFMRHIITGIDRRHSVAVEGLNKLSFQLEEQQGGRLDN